MTNGEKFKKVFGFGADWSRVIAVNAIWWDCQFQDSKPFTNAGRIRAMADEELADWFMGVCHASTEFSCSGCKFNALECTFLTWLKQEAE